MIIRASRLERTMDPCGSPRAYHGILVLRISPKVLRIRPKVLRIRPKVSRIRPKVPWIHPRCFYLFSKFWISFFHCFWLLACSRCCLESCGRLIGKKSTKWRPNPRDPLRAMTKKNNFPRERIFIKNGTWFSFISRSGWRICRVLTSDSASACQNLPGVKFWVDSVGLAPVSSGSKCSKNGFFLIRSWGYLRSFR